MDINEQINVIPHIVFKKQTNISMDIELYETSPDLISSKTTTYPMETGIEVSSNLDTEKLINLVATEVISVIPSTGEIIFHEYNLISNVILFEANLSTNIVTLEVILPSWRDHVT